MIAALAGALVASAAVGGLALAAIPGSDGVIHGCYKNGGNLRVIDPAAQKKDDSSCKQEETPLDWSQQGPRGGAGPTGPRGLKGDTGERGPQGPPGIVTSLADLDGVSCTAGGKSGTVDVSVAANGAITLTCQVVVVPPDGNGDCHNPDGSINDADVPAVGPHMTGTCTNGVPSTQCASGFANPDGNPVNGCEIDLLNDPLNCGSVGNNVSHPPHALGACFEGKAMIVSCESGWANSNKDPSDGCEAQLAAWRSTLTPPRSERL